MNLLDHLSPEQLQKGARIQFEKGQILAHERDICKGVYFLIKGKIRISSYALSGREMVYNSVSGGMMFGNNLVYSDAPEFRGNVLAETSGELVYFEKTVLLGLLRENAGFQEAFLAYQANFVKKLNAKIKLLSLGTAEERLDYLLYTGNGEIRYQSVTQLAGELGLSREATSRLLHRQEKSGRIALGKHKILLRGN